MSKFDAIRKAMSSKQISALKGEQSPEDKEQERLQALYEATDDDAKKARIKKIAEDKGLTIK
jgi:hypothetical protein